MVPTADNSNQDGLDPAPGLVTLFVCQNYYGECFEINIANWQEGSTAYSVSVLYNL